MALYKLHEELEYLHAMELRTGCRFYVRFGYNHAAPWVGLDDYHQAELWMWSPEEPLRSYRIGIEKILEYDEDIGPGMLAKLFEQIEGYMLDHSYLIPDGAPILNDSMWQFNPPVRRKYTGTPQPQP